MKRLILILGLILAGGQLYNNYAQFTQPSITFDKTSFNFGNINELGGPVSHEFTFTNNGSQPLLINDITTTCGCTVPEWNREPIPPGGSGKVKVTFDPQGRPGAFRKSIHVKSNAREEETTIYIVGLVNPKPKTAADDFLIKMGNLRVATNHVAMQNVMNTQIKVDSLPIYNDSDSVLNVGISGAPDWMTFNIQPKVLEPKKKGIIYIALDGSKVHDWGFILSRVLFNLNGNLVQNNMLAISANLVEDFSKLTDKQKLSAPKARLDAESYNFGTIKPGEPVEHDFLLTNDGKDPLIIRKISTTCGCTASKPEKYEIGAGESTTLKCTFNSNGKVGKQFQTITLTVNDPLQPTLVMRFLGDVDASGK